MLWLAPLSLWGQSDLSYDWEATPQLHELDSSYADAGTVMVLDKHEVAFYYDIKDDL